MAISAEDVRTAARLCTASLAPGADRDWGGRAGGLDWSCRRTLDHLPDALLLYAAHLASRATDRLAFVRDGDPEASVPDLLDAVQSAAAILAAVVEAAPVGTRAYHPAGMADAEGFAAMGCDEILVHTGDIAEGLGLEYAPPGDLCARVVARLFPWAPAGGEPWEVLRWANGRTALPGAGRLRPDWWWHCAPLDEWDGRTKSRTVPPAW